MLAIFDFDGTISDAFSSLLIFKHLSALQITKTFGVLIWEKLTGRGDYQRQLVRVLTGLDKSTLIEIGKNAPEIEATVELLRKMQQRGHEVLVLSYGIKPVIESFFEHRGINVDVIAIDLDFEEGKVSGPAKDSMTQLLLADSKYAKHRIIRLKKLKPKFSVGDCEKRDKHSKHYLAVQTFSGPFMRLRQLIRSFSA
ncbi:MAG: hypothetical protein GOV00_03425 [Candidatus Altiarchaeota archaeon]|nr:hypothetical protein [Candidatus Altiarchaeota archaeon]